MVYCLTYIKTTKGNSYFTMSLLGEMIVRSASPAGIWAKVLYFIAGGAVCLRMCDVLQSPSSKPFRSLDDGTVSSDLAVMIRPIFPFWDYKSEHNYADCVVLFFRKVWV